MHANQYSIDENLLQKLLQSQCPQWSELPIAPVPSGGTEYALFRLGQQYIARLPLIPGGETCIDKEYVWVPKLAICLSVPISEPLYKGKADALYPSTWMVCRWNEGLNPDFERGQEHGQLAIDLACFLNEFHNIKLHNGPKSRRGLPLKSVDQWTRKAISQLEGEVDTRAILEVWEKLLATPAWIGEPAWIHGDMLPGNVLVKDGRLSAVIDFSDVGTGDPAVDLIIAWSLLNKGSRRVFRGKLDGIDENTWQRGKGWALSIALIMLPYYKHSNPYMAGLARRMIEQVMSES